MTDQSIPADERPGARLDVIALPTISTSPDGYRGRPARLGILPTRLPSSEPTPGAEKINRRAASGPAASRRTATSSSI